MELPAFQMTCTHLFPVSLGLLSTSRSFLTFLNIGFLFNTAFDASGDAFNLTPGGTGLYCFNHFNAVYSSSWGPSVARHSHCSKNDAWLYTSSS
ncbi:hypothetical protein BCR35DRAFT_192317 [Leucosporidium creatinivorum]|uniref:Uncharacterized protein n=1 Tax=Leucosporidium creatinivorum TaxID=106004 RepID=A0A1Y2G0B7_9BASI|nr:hypothetical protein BCR35DRAFT_192317 [Leucosporidium creatinivorum]